MTRTHGTGLRSGIAAWYKDQRPAAHAAILASVVLLLVACGAEPAVSPSSTPSASVNPSPSQTPSATPLPPSDSASPSPSPTPSVAQEGAVVEPPDDLLPPGSIARVTADDLRVRGGPPGAPEHEDVPYTLNEGDLVLVEWSPLAYRSPSESGDGRGWYHIRVGGTSPSSQVSGWVAVGETGLEYLEPVPVSCGSERSLENLIFSSFDGDAGTIAPPWERLACNGDRQLELHGVFDYVCPELGVYPHRFQPFLAHPQSCTALMIDAYDAEGHAQYGQGLVVRFPEFAPTDLGRGDVLRVRGHFDDPLATSCSAETEAGFEGPAVDVPFLVLFCREQFVPDEWQLVDHRDLAPLPWEP